ncbi:ShlB/FhaC/HecB family hemolysin secretion/activation protein [Sphingomonas aracearum]|uniref:ShlB/FhaC/HecB family hemolysin secretion/activation protein n=1 Tax=Sphingomonas aracearum TaxID=2283317 RepID=A0A369VWH2_9SPHN|nr:ShlB/FhaC/HecB family hemolysin secretion/activation protein [Sphingomonas aracearum]RDE05927.1 ShlB/FhaC/HecB family hemolysin secretion/activation protein [Sphingomonas aracearum]
MARFSFLQIAAILPALAAPGVVRAQTALDRVDPSRVVEKAPKPAAPETQAPVDVPADGGTVAVGSAPITVGAVTLAGLQQLHPSDFADIFEIYVGRTLSPAALGGLADALAARARDRGYPFASATILPQSMVAGTIRVTMDEGRIDDIRLVGVKNDAALAALTPLRGRSDVTLAELERRLLLAGDIDGLWLRRSRLVREGERNILVVEMGSDPLSARIGIGNDGSRPVGPVQADVTVMVAQLLAEDDSLSLSAFATPVDPREFAYARLRYGKRVSTAGTEVSIAVSGSRTRPGAYLRDYDIAGRSWTVNVGVLQPLLRSRTGSLWLEGSFGLRTVKQERADRLIRRDRLSVLRLGAYGFSPLAGGRLRAGVTVAQGIDLFDATQADDPLASRRDADGTFTSISLWSEWSGAVAGPLSAQLGVASQKAFQPLLVSEETGLGGGSFLRGYDYSERSGDDGVMASSELRLNVLDHAGPVSKPQLYTFVDGGRVTNLENGFGTGTLFSAGGGVRATLARTFSADIGLAFPLSGLRYDSGDSDPVVNFRLSKRF